MCLQICQHISLKKYVDKNIYIKIKIKKYIYIPIPTIYFDEFQCGSWENDPTINHTQLFSALTVVNVLVLLLLLFSILLIYS